ncbi:unnamed protein product, partial [Amoebophrya sp. A25]|eukprot:GSA25T00011105001.1
MKIVEGEQGVETSVKETPTTLTTTNFQDPRKKNCTTTQAGQMHSCTVSSMQIKEDAATSERA